MPFYVADYLADTSHLTTCQHGAYFLLILAAWKRGGRLPNDAKQLRAICRLSPKAWRESESILRKFFQEDGDELVHARVLHEFGRATEIAKKRQESGKLGGRPSRQDGEKAKANGLAKPKQNETPSQSQLQETLRLDSQNEETQQNGKSAVRSKGCRLPDSFPANVEMLYAAGQGMDRERAASVAEDFRDFWSAKAGAGAVKLDWPATWRRWVREDLKRGHRPKAGAQQRVPWI